MKIVVITQLALESMLEKLYFLPVEEIPETMLARVEKAYGVQYPQRRVEQLRYHQGQYEVHYTEDTRTE